MDDISIITLAKNLEENWALGQRSIINKFVLQENTQKMSVLGIHKAISFPKPLSHSINQPSWSQYWRAHLNTFPYSHQILERKRKVTANVWGFQLRFPILAAFLSHPLSKVQRCSKLLKAPTFDLPVPYQGISP